MIAVDSSVWIDRLGNRQTPQTTIFERLLLSDEDLAIGDLMLVEVLQGTREDRAFRIALAQLSSFRQFNVSSAEVAVHAAQHYRSLRSLGITPRKTIDTLIATRCIIDGIPLLYSDRDFDPFVRHLGLRSALDLPGVN